MGIGATARGHEYTAHRYQIVMCWTLFGVYVRVSYRLDLVQRQPALAMYREEHTMNTSFEQQAHLAQVNGLWYNTQIRPGITYGPFSGDAMTDMQNFIPTDEGE